MHFVQTKGVVGDLAAGRRNGEGKILSDLSFSLFGRARPLCRLVSASCCQITTDASNVSGCSQMISWFYVITLCRSMNVFKRLHIYFPV
jgi:hypothetical protein